MSHCTKIDVAFKNKRYLFKAMKNLNMSPESRIWNEFSNEFKKKVSIGGTVMGRLLTGYYNGLNIFFTETDSEFVLNFESHQMDEERLKTEKYIVKELTKEYLRVLADNLKNDFIRKGIHSEVIEIDTTNDFLLKININDASKQILLNLDETGILTENVIGVVGKSCLDVTNLIESSVAKTVDRTWTHEYNSVIEDKVIQVLKLRNS